MFPCAQLFFGLWWVLPLIMLIMMGFCFFMMRGHKGPMPFGPGCCGRGSPQHDAEKKQNMSN